MFILSLWQPKEVPGHLRTLFQNFYTGTNVMTSAKFMVTSGTN